MKEVLEDNILMSILLLSMFVLSGGQKVGTFNKTVDSLKQRIKLPEMIYKLAIIVVIMIEIIAPIIIINYFMTKQYKNYAYYSTLTLIGFTVLATIIYHPPDFTNYYKSVAFWANVSLIGGLLFLAKEIKN
jgi:uncharacterized membrane protein YphA (DoxX/SURF4 family)